MRMMGSDSVAYHRQTIVDRADDHAGQALDYYASRGETPLTWGGSGAERLGLVGPVTDAQYVAVYGPGGACDPTTGRRLVRTLRPGMELVISAHKSVAELGVLGRAEDMHEIMDAERDATLAYLDGLTRWRGGRRGRSRTPAATSGLIYAHARHATSRAGDPCPHDHVLLANVVEMLDRRGGYKAPDTTLWREHLHAATMVGRMAAARRAVELGYAIELDHGPSGRLGHWAIAGIPKEALEIHSKRSAEIDAEMAERGYSSYQARNIVARETRKAKRHTPVADLLPRWRAELAEAGFPTHELAAGIEAASAARSPLRHRLQGAEVGAIVERVAAPDGTLAERKVFARRDVVVAVAPCLYGLPVNELDRVVGRALADPEVLPLLGVAGARGRAYALARTVAVEAAIAEVVARRAKEQDVAVLTIAQVVNAVWATEADLGGVLTDGQRDALFGVCTSGAGVDLVLGVAGSGKTTAISGVRHAYEGAGYRVVGTSTSGQAARTLGTEAGIDVSRTLRSLLWRLDHGRLELDSRTVVVHDEAGMATDADVLRLLVAAELAGAKVVMVGDDRQLGAVGPGGALRALLERHRPAVHILRENVRQEDPAERRALAHLRAGDVGRAIAWYADQGRVVTARTRDEALDAMVDAWATDLVDGQDTAMYAWRRANVEELNGRARARMASDGRLSGPELTAPGGRCYAAGDRIVSLAPGADGQLVTSERGRVLAVNPATGTLLARMDDGRTQPFGREETTAERLALGYAVTIHRSQATTVDTAHRYEDGGGRELAYVGISRARRSSHVYVVADDLDQAVEDLVRDWSAERRPRWAIDTGTPTPGLAPSRNTASIPPESALRLARLRAEREAVVAAIPPDPRPLLRSVESQLVEFRQAQRDLEPGWAHYPSTPEGEAARALTEAQYRRRQAEEFARMDGMGWRSRRDWRRTAREWSEHEVAAQDHYDGVAGPELGSLSQDIEDLEGRQRDLSHQLKVREEWLSSHPEAARRIEFLDREVARAELAVSPSIADDLTDRLGRHLSALQGRSLAPDLGLDAGIDLGP
jgi:conjugative relaxase-like TrwC/TraI family protein